MLLKFVVSKNSYLSCAGERFLINTNNLKLVNKIYSILKRYAAKNGMIIGVERCIPMSNDIPKDTIILPQLSEKCWALLSNEGELDLLLSKFEIHKILKELGLDIIKTHKVYDRTLYSVIKFDYDTKNCYDKIMNDIQKMIDTFGTDIQKITIHETMKGYHTRIYLSKYIPIDEKIKIYSDSNQDFRRTRRLESVRDNLKCKINKKYIESVLQFYDVLFYKKMTSYCHEYTERLVMKL